MRISLAGSADMQSHQGWGKRAAGSTGPTGCALTPTARGRRLGVAEGRIAPSETSSIGSSPRSSKIAASTLTSDDYGEWAPTPPRLGDAVEVSTPNAVFVIEHTGYYLVEVAAATPIS
jgi:hypothetical protein